MAGTTTTHHRRLMPLPFPRRLLFSLPPETAHTIAMKALHWHTRLAPPPPPPRIAAKTVMGLHFPNPIGLAAGFDKNGEHINALRALGFGFIEIGAVTPQPQSGNPTPRLFRLPAAQAIINRMGFNNIGADAVARNLQQHQYRGILGINLGKNAATDDSATVNDYCSVLTTLYPYGDFFTLNLSSPNTQNLRQWQHGEKLDTLLAGVMKQAKTLAGQTAPPAKPIAVKISPDLSDEPLKHIADACHRHGIAAVIACNTTLSRPDSILSQPHSNEAGGLSGKPLTEKSTAVIAKLRTLLPTTVTIIGVGGIFTPQDAKQKLAAGADLLQLYTALIYQGPRLPQTLLNAL